MKMILFFKSFQYCDCILILFEPTINTDMLFLLKFNNLMLTKNKLPRFLL